MDKVYSVSALGNIIKQIFDFESMLQGIKLTGEVSGYNIVRGIAYFSVKDENAVMPCVLFGADKYGMFKDGDLVVLTGSPKFYVKGGKLSFNASHIELFGLGNLFQQFLLIKEKLEKEGLFDQAHKKPIKPPYQRIGVVTSATGAVIQDIINVTLRRDSSIDIVLYPVRVQGENAEDEIAKGIQFFSNYNVDVVVVARGGGSLEDLRPFNTELVARAVHACTKPIISAVGHETDFTICDFASDLRAPTPSAAAELATVHKNEQKQRFDNLLQRLISAERKILTAKHQTFVYITEKMEHAFTKAVSKKENNLKHALLAMQSAAASYYEGKAFALSMASNSLEKINPTAVLARGFAKVNKLGKTITTINDVIVSDELTIELIDGTVYSTATQTKRRTV